MLDSKPPLWSRQRSEVRPSAKDGVICLLIYFIKKERVVGFYEFYIDKIHKIHKELTSLGENRNNLFPLKYRNIPINL